MIQLNTPKDNITHHKLKIKVKVEVKANVKIEVRKGKVRQGNSTQRKARQGKAGKGRVRSDATTQHGTKMRQYDETRLARVRIRGTLGDIDPLNKRARNRVKKGPL